MLSKGQIMSKYHSKILRIPHGSRIYTKRILLKEQIIKLFTGTVSIQEKVDGKLSIRNENIISGNSFNYCNCLIEEDMTHKNTVHNHIMHYNNLPADKRILLDVLEIDEQDILWFRSPVLKSLEFATLKLQNPTIEEIHAILEVLSTLPSHFGSGVIEGLIIKNYKEQLMGKWINEEFEDKLD